jgi:hypothetical protein
MAVVSLGTSRAVSYSVGGKNACVLEEGKIGKKRRNGKGETDRSVCLTFALNEARVSAGN